MFSKLVPFLTDRKSTTVLPSLSALITDLWSRFDSVRYPSILPSSHAYSSSFSPYAEYDDTRVLRTVNARRSQTLATSDSRCLISSYRPTTGRASKRERVARSLRHFHRVSALCLKEDLDEPHCRQASFLRSQNSQYAVVCAHCVEQRSDSQGEVG